MVRRKGYIFVLSTTLILCFIVMIFTAVSQSSVMTNTTECKKNSVIVIDCGHGGEDPGAVGVNNVYESDVNLSFGLKFNDILKLNGYDTILQLLLYQICKMITKELAKNPTVFFY